MNKRVRAYAVIGVVIILFGFLIATTPLERIHYSEEFTPLEIYPMYYFANFTVASSDTNAKASIDMDVDYGDNYTSYTTLWILYQLQLEEFEENFNLTQARDTMMGGDWDLEDLDAFWAGGFAGVFPPTSWEPVSPGAYVFVFWFETDGSTTGWSATLLVSLRTSILPRA